MEVTSSLPKKGISGSTLKLIAIIAMLIDHTAAVVLERMLMRGIYSTLDPNGWLDDHMTLYLTYQIMRIIGRFGFPIFCFLLVEGFMYTHSKAKYALRLFLFALISEIPFDLALHGNWFYKDYQNVFFTLLLGLLAMIGFDYIKKLSVPRPAALLLRVLGTGFPSVYIGFLIKKMLSPSLTQNIFELLSIPYDIHSAAASKLILVGCSIIVFIIILIILLTLSLRIDKEYRTKICGYLAALFTAMFIADLLKTDYSGMGVLTIAMMYAFRHHRVKEMLAGCITLAAMSFSELSAFLMLIPAALYNGTRGWNIKYFFYAFYPVHLLLLYLVCVWMKLV